MLWKAGQCSRLWRNPELLARAQAAAKADGGNRIASGFQFLFTGIGEGKGAPMLVDFSLHRDLFILFASYKFPPQLPYGRFVEDLWFLWRESSKLL